ncbi:unnamed protein product [Caenorhabditis sp. 36 PRJEB53466]|nr:unnamed protein product [Caenorhabditis sp. 36 PRJEB53466]
MSSGQLICPLCCACLKEEGAHFFKHFRYKRFTCGESSCDLGFYTESERNAHCAELSHKRSFQKTVNPYIDNLIKIITEDARKLATESMESVLASRFESSGEQNISVTPSAIPKKKRTLQKRASTPVLTKKTKQCTPGSEQSSSNSTSSADPKHRTNSASAPSGNAVFEVDSTTNEVPVVPSSTEKQKRTRKSRTEFDPIPTNLTRRNTSYDEMSPFEKLAGWYDPNVPERQNAAKIRCEECNKDIVYDYIIRKSHVTKEHMAADVAAEDYEGILKAAMEKSYPGYPNSNFSCQLCMGSGDVAKNRRREHIETMHSGKIPDLRCPICERGFKRQCGLSTHMKEEHKTSMCHLKNSVFQKERHRRNAMIGELTTMCFPWAKIEPFECKSAEPSGSLLSRYRSNSERNIPATNDGPIVTDVRLRDAHKTRRAPRYNSSSGSSTDDEESGAPDDTGSEKSTDFTKDVEFIGQQFISEITRKLLMRNSIKPEEQSDDKATDQETSTDQGLSRGSTAKTVKQEPVEEPQTHGETDNSGSQLSEMLPLHAPFVPTPVSPLPVQASPSPKHHAITYDQQHQEQSYRSYRPKNSDSRQSSYLPRNRYTSNSWLSRPESDSHNINQWRRSSGQSRWETSSRHTNSNDSHRSSSSYRSSSQNSSSRGFGAKHTRF